MIIREQPQYYISIGQTQKNISAIDRSTSDLMLMIFLTTITTSSSDLKKPTPTLCLYNLNHFHHHRDWHNYTGQGQK